MNFSIENPKAFFLIIPLGLAILYSVYKYFRLSKALAENNEVQKESYSFVRFRRCFTFRTSFRALAGIMIICALAGISWGANLIPVQKNGKAVSMVFDISYSMEAQDAPESMTRLEAAANYAKEILKKIPDVRVSVVLSKGKGTIAIPLTEDFQSIYNLLDSLSPKMMTAEGSNLGNGILTAISSFPEQSSEAGFIWLFTDGEETETSLQNALNEAALYGIPVVILGFGSEVETEVLAGDGISSVKTALRSTELNKIVENVLKKNSGKNNKDIPPVTYIDASEFGSGYKLLELLSLEKNEVIISYETHLVRRQKFFVLLGILFYIASLFFGELDLRQGKKKILSTMTTGMCLFMFLSCNARAEDGKNIFDGNLNWNRKDYQSAIADFIQVEYESDLRGDNYVKDYALYGLATTYLMQEETEIALEHFNQISPEASDNIKFAVLYNSGIIAHRKGEYSKAVELFKQALIIDNTNIDAKINMELSLQGKALQQKQGEQQQNPINESNDDKTLEQELFSIIRENEQKQWKNQQKETKSSVKDY